MDSNASLDDDELNKMIANLQGQPDATPPAIVNHAEAPATTPVPAATVPPTPVQPSGPVVTTQGPAFTAPDPAAITPSSPDPVSSTSPELDNIKKSALSELRPLVDKLDLPAEDKFDTLLLLIRSTDDSSLIPAAHTAATQIADEKRRAQALLDIIKEIDFFGQNSAK